MAGIFRDGFDAYNGTTAPVGLASKWTVAGAPTLTTGRFAGQAVTLSGANINAAMTAAAQGTFHASIQVTGFGTDKALKLRSGTTEMVELTFLLDGSIRATRAGTTLGTSATGLVSLDTWYSLAWEFVISDTVGRITVYLDDWVTPVLNLTSADTRNGAPTTVSDCQLFSNFSSGPYFRVDDLYITDSATRVTTPVRVETLYPNGDGGTLTLTPSTGSSHYAVIDETPASSSDYLQGSTVGDLSEVTIGSLASTPDRIDEIGVVAFVQKTDATARSMALEVKSGATTSAGSNLALTTAGNRIERTLATDPDTSTAWTASGVNALRPRPKVTV